VVAVRRRRGARRVGWTLACASCWLICLSTLTASSRAATGPLDWSAPLVIDHATVPTQPAVLNGLSCAGGGRLCVGVGFGGQVQSSLRPDVASDWRSATINSGRTLQGVSCPSTTLCVAVGADGDLLSSVDPTAGSWRSAGRVFASPGYGLGGVACATVSLCVAVDGGTQIATSTDPAGGVWTVTSVSGAGQLDSVSCPSASLCVIGDFDGGVLTATSPADGASAYTSTDLTGDVNAPNTEFTLLSVSCGSATECVASDDNGDLIASDDPEGGASAWRTAHVDGINQLNSVSCAATGLCVAADGVGNVFASTAPNGTKASWRATDNVDPSGFGAVVCSSGTLCLAGGFDSSVAVSRNPSAAAPTWSETPQLGSGAARRAALVSISCPDASSCVTLDGAGNLLSTGKPAGGSAGWKSRALNPGLGSADSIGCIPGGSCVAAGPLSHVAFGDIRATAPWKVTNLNLFSIDDNGVEAADSLGQVSCASRSLCMAVDHSDGVGDEGLLEVSKDPAGGSWQQVSLGGPDYDFFTSVSCPSSRLCVAGDGQGDRFAVSMNGGRNWGFVRGGPGDGIAAVSCPTRTFCAAVDESGYVLTSTDPSLNRRAWHSRRIEHGSFTAIACASRSLCVAFGQRDRVLVSSDPGGGVSSWKPAALGSGLTGVACPSSKLCVVTTDAGTVRLGRRPHTARPRPPRG
jgi:hypothetical protein